jgi:hypothetical protein
MEPAQAFLKKWLIDRQVCRFRLSNSTGCNCVTGTSWSRVGGFLSLFHPPGPTCPPEEEIRLTCRHPLPVGWLFFWREKTLTCDDFKSYMAHNCRYFLQQHLIYSDLLQLPRSIVNLNAIFWIFTDLFRVIEINILIFVMCGHVGHWLTLKIIQRISFFLGGINRFTFSNERARALTLSLPVARFGFSGVQTNPDMASTRVCLLDIILGRRRHRESWTFFKNWKRVRDSLSKCYLSKWQSFAVIVHLFGHFRGDFQATGCRRNPPGRESPIEESITNAFT